MYLHERGYATAGVRLGCVALGRTSQFARRDPMGWLQHFCARHLQLALTAWPVTQVLDVRGGVMLAWEMNGKELLPDHGYPVSGLG